MSTATEDSIEARQLLVQASVIEVSLILIFHMSN